MISTMSVKKFMFFVKRLVLFWWVTKAVDGSYLGTVKKPLYRPPLQELAKVLNKGLQSNFQDVKVEVVDCPDLAKAPFTLAKPGLNGHPKLLQMGSISYLVPVARTDKIYDLKEIAGFIGLESTFFIGPGGISYSYAGTNCEGIFNLNIADGTLDQQSRLAYLDPNNEAIPLQAAMPSNESRASFLINLFISEGVPGKVLKIEAKKRTGNLDFPTSIRKTLIKEYPDKVVGLGGTFLVKEGTVLQHVVKNFTQISEKEAESEAYVNFYSMSAALIAVGYVINNDYGLDLTVQHFHSFSHHGQAGHYRNDTTPKTVEYLGYFNAGEEIYRGDRPTS